MEKQELLYNEIYERTKNFGRVQFINELMRLERQNKDLKRMHEHYYKYASDMESKYLMAKGVTDWLKIWLEDIQKEEFNINGQKGICTEIRIDLVLDKIKELEEELKWTEEPEKR